MDFIYPLGTGSRWNDYEIYYSMMLVLKLSEIKPRFHVVGSYPRFNQIKVNKFPEFVYYPIEQSKINRYHIVAKNLLDYIENHYTGSEFVLMNDDFLPIKPFNPKKMPLWFDGTIIDRTNKEGINAGYKLNLTNSKSNNSDLNFAVHLPMPVRFVHIFIEALKDSIRKPGGCSFRNLYGNRAFFNDKIELKEDVKYYGHIFLKDNLDPMTDWLSLSDDILLPQNVSHLTTLFSHILKQ